MFVSGGAQLQLGACWTVTPSKFAPGSVFVAGPEKLCRAGSNCGACGARGMAINARDSEASGGWGGK
ncbi:MAG: hypothetical protein DMD63_04215 [Gemmatimonadetes bacterium]|nr:MAG: hypothetical protein DMD63_04215 [Gemmatimonadota bacterium]